jgi:hypothetical protein
MKMTAKKRRLRLNLNLNLKRKPKTRGKRSIFSQICVLEGV